jgi:hypothetical protein
MLMVVILSHCFDIVNVLGRMMCILFRYENKGVTCMQVSQSSSVSEKIKMVYPFSAHLT